MTCGNCFKEIINEEGFCPSCGYDNAKNREAYPLALPAGSILYGRYIIGKVLGQGGFGITYLAQDYQTKDYVAIKEFFPGSMATRTGTTVVPYSGTQGENFTYGRTTFLDEAKTMAEFNGNPNIAGVQVYFEENGTAYFVMEYLDGCSFGDYISNHGGRLSWVDTARIMLPVIKVLGQIHEKGVIHRDVAPDNIYITKDGTVKLLDFGAARHSLGNVSQSLDVVIKHGFAPKEQYSRRGRQGPYTDVYAVCATIYYALTGVKPDESIDRAEEDTLPPPTILGAKISEPLEDVIMKGLSVDAKDRYQSAVELSAALTGQKGQAKTGTNDAAKPKETDKSKSTVHTKDDSSESSGEEKRQENEKKRKIIPAVCALVLCFVLFWFVHPHKYGDWVTTVEPSCEATGIKERECFCGHKETETIKKMGHFEVTDPGFSATCAREGLTDGVHCERCGKEIKQQQIIKKLEHELVKQPAVAATCTDNGYTEGYSCRNCDYVETEQSSIAALGHDFSGNDCTRCNAKKWWVEFTTTRKSFTIGERFEIHFNLHTNEVKKKSGGLWKPSDFLKPTTKMYHRLYIEYESGSTELTSPFYYEDGEEVSADTGWYAYWEKGLSRKARATLRIYNGDNYLLGSYTINIS